MTAQLLSSVPAGQRVRISSIEGGRQLGRRLLALGLSIGSEVEVLHHRSSGVVVACGGNRVALGTGVANKLYIEELD